MNYLDPLNIRLTGTHLIEASAGTGKTYTITGLYVRLLLERGLKVENILVVTYTEAACQELREGIRSRLLKAIAVFDNQQVDDDFLNGLRQCYEHQGQDIAKMKTFLLLALMDFDLAAVFTIHGFCMRVLQESAFESGFLFETELVENDANLLQQIIDDYWRARQQEWHPLFLAFLYHEGRSPDSLASLISSLYKAVISSGEEALETFGNFSSGSFDQQIIKKMTEIWQEQQDVIADLLTSPALSKAAEFYNKNNVEKWISDLNKFFNNEPCNPIPALQKLSREALLQGTQNSKSGLTPEHDFFGLCEDLFCQLKQAEHGMIRELLNRCLLELPVLKNKTGQVSFDDLLVGVRDGLRNPATGPKLAQKVLQQYPAALIDEFQDTDPIQFEIFKTVFLMKTDTSLFLVGDPKQAIYGFRNADIFAYISASKAKIDEAHTLAVNWRSESGLIEACNTLFKKHPLPFVLDDIAFHQVGCPPENKNRLIVQSGNDAPLVILRFADQDNRQEAKERVAQWTAEAIKDLLQKSAAGKIFYEKNSEGGNEPLKGGDIAVLVRTHREGELIKRHLTEAGINAVIQSRKSVFHSIEARELQLLLEAVFLPGDQRKIFAALATRLFGAQKADFEGFRNDERAWEDILQRFAEYNRCWIEKGIAAMLCWMMSREGVYQRLSRQAQAERRLTNLRHLVELLQEADHGESFSMDGLLKWFAQKRHGTDELEASQVRLESDDNLLKIVTVHKSKGLQYPVVFCPFAWDSSFMSNKKPEVVSYHDEHGNLKIDIGSGDQEGGRLLHEKERLAEEIRLFYVAVTRAQHRCFLLWGRVFSRKQPVTATSALQYILNSKDIPDDFISELKKSFSDKSLPELVEQIHELEKVSNGSILLKDIEPFSSAGKALPVDSDELQQACKFTRHLNHYLGIRSFSSLHSGAVHLEEPDHYDDEANDHKDIDASGKQQIRTVFSFPRGAQAGSCLHSVLENFDFQETDKGKIEDLVSRKLELFGFDSLWNETVQQFLYNIINTSLGGGVGPLKLSQISRRQRLDEMEFYYSLPAFDDSDLRRAFYETVRSQNLSLPASNGKGFMKGFIDLVFREQDKYYIVDYKSNYLGASSNDYRNESLAKAMRASGYDLQYHIYSLALHRYLKLRLANYDYDNNFGGIYYLFLRGMRPEENSSGVFHHRPEKNVVESFDKILG